MLWSLQTEDPRLISREIIFEVLQYRNGTDTFCGFCGIFGVNDLKSRQGVIHFGGNRIESLCPTLYGQIILCVHEKTITLDNVR